MTKTPAKVDPMKEQAQRLEQLRIERHGQTGRRQPLTWWASEYGIDYQTYKKAAAGNRKLQQDDALKIALYHGVSPQWLLYGNIGFDAMREDESEEADIATEDTVPVVGWVSAGDQVERYPLNETTLDYVLAPHGSNETTRALQIQGNSLGELFNRWLVFFDDEPRPVSPDLLNRLCVVELADGRVLVKKIVRKSGRYDLISNNEDPIENVQIRWAARVKSMEPR